MFNTNNIWVNLKSVKARLTDMKMEIIVNKKVAISHQYENEIALITINFPEFKKFFALFIR